MLRRVEMRLPTPIGELRLVASDDGLEAVYFPKTRGRPSDLHGDEGESHPVLDHAAGELTRYFQGDLRSFTTPLSPSGTEFQRAVWAALCEIPFGQTRSYAQVARAVGRPTAFRAVGAANGSNPLPLFVPCHRVIGTGGRLTGFGGGLPVKQWLLDHERQLEPGLGQADLFS